MFLTWCLGKIIEIQMVKKLHWNYYWIINMIYNQSFMIYIRYEHLRNIKKE